MSAFPGDRVRLGVGLKKKSGVVENRDGGDGDGEARTTKS